MARSSQKFRHHASSPLLRRLLREYVRPHRGKVILAMMCMIVVAATTAANAWLLQPVLDGIFVEQDRTMLHILPIAVAVIAVVSGLGNYGQTILMREIGQKVIARMQMQLFSHLMHADLNTFHEQASGRLISRFTNDIQLLRTAISNVLTSLVKELITMIALLGVMFYQSWQLSIFAFLLFPAAILPIFRLGRRMRKISDGTQRQLGEFTAQLDETFQGARIVKAYAREDYEINRANRTIGQLYTLYFKAARVQALASPMIETLSTLAVAGVIWYGGEQVLKGATTPGAFFSFIAAMIMAYRPVKQVATLNTQLQEGLAAASRFFEAIDVEATIQDRGDARPLQITNGHVLLDQVTFRYHEEGGGVVGTNIDIPSGKVVALVGSSGSGKSTIINLILRFYDAQGGRILIDGQDIRNVTLQSLRQSVALVSQDTILFDDTVRGNIAYGNLGASDEAIIDAAKQANAHEFITRMPQGYDTPIGPHGVKLSGGQRQRLSIARAILKDAPILLLDEATSALDQESERSVQAALNRLMMHRTTLVVAHRLSTIQNASVIYVMDHGRIVESGNHTSLMAQQGRYYHFYRDIPHEESRL